MTPLDPGAKRKPALDEASFQQVLAAAYVLQQHNDSLRARDPRLDSGWILTQVAETQSLLRAGGLDPKTSTKLIADRLRTMTDSAGVSISLTTNGILKCVAESGAAAKVPGNSIASHSLVATERLRNGRVFQSADAQKDIRLDLAACREMSVQGLLAVPIQQSGEIAGVIEVRWSKPDGFHESDVRTCQVMATLVTDVLEREDGSGVNAVATARADIRQPLPALASDEEPASKFPESDGPAMPAEEEPTSQATPSETLSDSPPEPARRAESLASQCRVCGRPFLTNEAFCGNCSMPRLAGAPSEDLQSKWASLWYMQQAQDITEEGAESPDSQAAASRLESQARENAAWQEQEQYQEEKTRTESVWRRPETVVESPPTNSEPLSTVSLDYEAIAPASWDATIRAAWERTSEAVRRRLGRRGTLVAMAALALMLILAVWSAWPAASSSQLTWFESVLVELGLAQVPSRTPAAPTGNPDVRVWVDVHTALYYCPGSDLYGKTPGGQFETQHDAQQDKFDPATGAVCE